MEYLLDVPDQPRLLYVFAHGAGAGMHHRFMQDVSARLNALGVATLRYQFPYIETGRKSPDVPRVLEATVRRAIELAATELPDVPRIAGGKSMGGRMTSHLLSKEKGLPVRGLAFVGFPLHQPNKPGRARAAHLSDVVHPMLFLQGTRDTLADLTLIREVTSELPLARLHVVEGGDHSFAVLKKSGRTNEEVLDELASAILEFGLSVA